MNLLGCSMTRAGLRCFLVTRTISPHKVRLTEHFKFLLTGLSNLRFCCLGILCNCS